MNTLPMPYPSLANFPLPYRVAAEVLLGHGERTQARLNGLFDHFEAAYGLTGWEESTKHRNAATAYVEHVMHEPLA